MKDNNLKDSGERLIHDTGAIREPDPISRFDLIPWDVIIKLAEHYGNGAKKYSPRNWEKGFKYSNLFNSCMRHVIKAFMGMTDEDHVSAAIWNLASLGHFKNCNRDGELDDLKDNTRLQALLKAFNMEGENT